jgi:iron(III) transport system ATP-binding protein
MPPALSLCRGACDVLLRADDIVHDDEAPVKARSCARRFAAPNFCTPCACAGGQIVQAHVPSHHDHRLGEWIGIRAEVDHVVTFKRGRHA